MTTTCTRGATWSGHRIEHCTSGTEHPAIAAMREQRERAIARGYVDGDVSHNLQPVIGLLRRRGEYGVPLDEVDLRWAIGKLTLACEAEIAWLALRDEDPK